MPCILIVEDDKNQRLLLQEELEQEGYTANMVSSGPEALRSVAKQMPDLVVLDLAMPGMDGVELLAKLLSINNQLPVIIHTAFSSYQDNFMTWSADAYVIKHHSFEGLKDAIRQVLAKRQQSGSLGPGVAGTS